jgi:ATP-dependent RNA helicase TDRD9
MIILAHAFGCTDEALIMAAAMSLRSMFISSFHHNIDVFDIKQQWSQSNFSDSLISLQVFQEWKSRVERRVFTSFRNEMDWCKRQMVFHKTLLEIDKLSTELRKRLESCFKLNSIVPNTRSSSSSSNSDHHHRDSVLLTEERSLLLRCILFGAFYPNYITGTIEDINAYYSAIHEPKRFFTDPLCSVYVNQYVSY